MFSQNWRNKLHRRNLNPNGASLLRGRIYNRTKKQGKRTDLLPDNLSGSQTIEKLATDYGVTSRTIERDGQFARAVETVKAACAVGSIVPGGCTDDRFVRETLRPRWKFRTTLSELPRKNVWQDEAVLLPAGRIWPTPIPCLNRTMVSD